MHRISTFLLLLVFCLGGIGLCAFGLMVLLHVIPANTFGYLGAAGLLLIAAGIAWGNSKPTDH